MADLQEPQISASSSATSGQEPSMEEILASIRKIIADEPGATPANGTPPGDVVELTQMVQDDGSVVDLKAAPEPPKEPAMSPVPPPPPKASIPPAPPAPPASPLMSEPATTAATSALSSLASTVEMERLSASAPGPSTFIGNGARTLEEMVMELMRPMLKEWLDKNLPSTVDRLVQKEIERISRKVQD